jgi:transposase
MTRGKPYSVPFRQKMVERMTGRYAVNTVELAKETGVPQQNLSRWRQQAHSVPEVAAKRSKAPKGGRSVEQKAALLMEAAKLSGEELAELLAREGVLLSELESWRIALGDGVKASKAVIDRVRELERELARKEKALAEAAALLILKKKLTPLLWAEEDDDTDEGNDK